ncbi:imidazole glycerol phosphate synthase subunit HisH [Shumkonia mesophila]|uniref:imidazole glycerol phosphate synthase subunit HisH n=1 Tax=Shumkonia mesophila TaxID=2838854 RepID=UPI002934D796|nr:imidazole glycerol phosphate synthase subunit HisH [Shumkonia mesophila]
MITIIDYGMGNLRSVANAFEALGREVQCVGEPEALASATAIVLPGVGAFGDAMENLWTKGLVDALDHEVRGKGKPFLGLCLGLQLLAERGTEQGDHRGLGWIPGVCRRLERRSNDPDIHIPHIGWNDVSIRKAEGLYRDLGDVQAFYFVHSYILCAADDSVVSGICDHGEDFAASIETGNVWATQFHPEKSHKAGLSLLNNWCAAARC